MRTIIHHIPITTMERYQDFTLAPNIIQVNKIKLFVNISRDINFVKGEMIMYIKSGTFIGPVPRKHVNFYDFFTLPGYERYFISPIGGFWSGCIGGHYISKGGTGARAGRTAGTAMPKW